MTMPRHTLSDTPKPVELTILGQRMVLRADEDPKHLQRLASYINRKADEVSSGAAVATAKLAVLAALNIANDYFRALDENREFKREVAAKSRALLAELESADESENVTPVIPNKG